MFAKVLERAQLSGHTPYDLRHTFATLHLAKGHPITYVSAQLGHSDPSTTLLSLTSDDRKHVGIGDQ